MQNSSEPNPVDSEPQTSKSITLTIKRISSNDHKMNVSRNASVLQIKERIQTELDLDKSLQRLILAGKVLRDNQSLADHGPLKDDPSKTEVSLHLVMRPIGTQSNPTNDQPNPHSWHHSSRENTGNPQIIELVTVSSTISDFTSPFSPFAALSNLPLGTPASRRASQLTRITDMIRHVRQLLDRPADQSDSAMADLGEGSTPSASTSDQPTDLASVLDDLATLMETVAPRLRELRGPLTSRTEPSRVDQMAGVIDNLAVANHFVCSLLSSYQNETGGRGNPFSGNLGPRSRTVRTRSPATGNTPSSRSPGTAAGLQGTTTGSNEHPLVDESARQKRKESPSVGESSVESAQSCATKKSKADVDTRTENDGNGKGKEKED